MAKSIKKNPQNSAAKKPAAKAAATKKSASAPQKQPKPKKKITKAVGKQHLLGAILPSDPSVIDRLWTVVLSRRDANPANSHSARLLSRRRRCHSR